MVRLDAETSTKHREEEGWTEGWGGGRSIAHHLYGVMQTWYCRPRGEKGGMRPVALEGLDSLEMRADLRFNWGLKEEHGVAWRGVTKEAALDCRWMVDGGGTG